MNNYITVAGESPFYIGLKMKMWIAVKLIYRVYPVHAVKGQDGHFYKCTPNHENAEIVSYMLQDHSGNEYYCDDVELKKIGIAVKEKGTKIGFIPDDNNKIEEL